MATNAAITLAEPTLPPEVLAEMERLNAESGTTFLLSTHDARVIAHSHRRIEMVDGRITGDEYP